jgi:hypothetical protein
LLARRRQLSLSSACRPYKRRAQITGICTITGNIGPLKSAIQAALCARPWMGADYATRREPSHLREPIAHHVNIREAAPEALSTLSLAILAHPMPAGVPLPGQRGKS